MNEEVTNGEDAGTGFLDGSEELAQAPEGGTSGEEGTEAPGAASVAEGERPGGGSNPEAGAGSAGVDDGGPVAEYDYLGIFPNDGQHFSCETGNVFWYEETVVGFKKDPNGGPDIMVPLGNKPTRTEYPVPTSEQDYINGGCREAETPTPGTPTVPVPGTPSTEASVTPTQPGELAQTGATGYAGLILMAILAVTVGGYLISRAIINRKGGRK